ncbi:MAG: NAD(P)-dependent oxidoreductase [Lautropia sp.]|nr:MAG: NAD(P)-dependent oxidoreductase [Pseudomonadota bacterium]MBC6959438.1 NAD(P)-dependent oxidoreductase [Lautropia sp.]MCL4702761.1 NAD(P)-dependent oxidoreductase [Burkholderiaceae bacterium]MDL1908547.1 NAD(P)-dependent oxidoreductase [Betaproteobacteria bacterium PRO1]RIK89290.1 MAG: 2-hydroxy-3-oxopropionate reductase [Burkholderiales bacterium]
MSKIGFVGAGVMGAPMIGHLLDAGHEVAVHVRRREAAAALFERGARYAQTPAEAARGAEFVCTNVTGTADVESVLFGENGAAGATEAGAIVIDFSTISAVATRGFARRLAQQRIDMLDCPVSGGAAGARQATLSISVGGDAAVLERARPLLERLGRTITHVGGHGAGQVVKACNQIVQVINIEGIAEAMLFASANGVDPARMLPALQAGMAGSRMLDLMGPKMAERDFAAGIEARLHQKDFGIVVEATQALGLSLPAAAIVSQQLNALVGNGWGRDDTSSLLRVLEGANRGRAANEE